jgi:hypothetical protein
MYSGITIIYYRRTVGHNTVAKHTDVHIPARRKCRPLPLWGSSVPKHSVTKTLDRARVWKWPTTVAVASEVPGHYRVLVSSLPRDLADLKARIIPTVKNIDAPMLTSVWQELDFRIDVSTVDGTRRTSLVVKKKKTFSVFLLLWTIPSR